MFSTKPSRPQARAMSILSTHLRITHKKSARFESVRPLAEEPLSAFSHNLVDCFPMRTLVEQTADVTCCLVEGSNQQGLIQTTHPSRTPPRHPHGRYRSATIGKEWITSGIHPPSSYQGVKHFFASLNSFTSFISRKQTIIVNRIPSFKFAFSMQQPKSMIGNVLARKYSSTKGICLVYFREI